MSKKLTNYDFCEAAKDLKCEVAAVKAVAQVESAGDGFLPDGRVIILFERHHFSKFTRGKYDESHPQISSKKAGGYYGKEKEYQRFNLAFSLDPTAAMKSTSWGKFQIMGFNHELVGYSSVGAFVDAMKLSEGEQLKAFCQFVKRNKLDTALRKLDWDTFARGYNGKNYAINKYDTKMATAYRKFAKEAIDCSSISQPEDTSPKEEIIEQKKEDLEQPQNGAMVSTTPSVDVPKIDSKPDETKETPGIPASVGAAVTFATTTGSGILAWIAGSKTEIIYGLFIAATIVGLFFVWRRFNFANAEKQRQFESNEAEKRRNHEIQMAMITSAQDPNKLTVNVVPNGK